MRALRIRRSRRRLRGELLWDGGDDASRLQGDPDRSIGGDRYFVWFAGGVGHPGPGGDHVHHLVEPFPLLLCVRVPVGRKPRDGHGDDDRDRPPEPVSPMPRDRDRHGEAGEGDSRAPGSRVALSRWAERLADAGARGTRARSRCGGGEPRADRPKGCFGSVSSFLPAQRGCNPGQSAWSSHTLHE